MRDAFAAAITAAAARDDRVVLLTADVGNRLFDTFRERFPDRFVNCGVAEANMVGVAAGLALDGLRPFAYSIAPFVVIRALEQIRIDVCSHAAPVTIVGTGAGLAYGALGPTHHACEDVAVLRCLPGMAVVCPADRAETTAAVAALVDRGGPAYLRLGKKGEPDVHAAPPALAIGRALLLREGADVCLLGCGTLTAATLAAADLLAAAGVTARVASLHTVKPLDDAFLAECFARFPLVVVAEEHGMIGGLGAAVSEWRTSRARPGGGLECIGTPDAFLHAAGSQAWLREHCGLSAGAIAARVLARLGRSP